MKSVFFKSVIVLGLGFSSHALFATEKPEQNQNQELIKKFELTFGIQGDRRYISIPVKSGYQNTRTSLLSYFDQKEPEIKLIHGKEYVISSVNGVVPSEYLDDSASEFEGHLINRSTDTTLGKTIDSVYEYTFESGYIERFSVHYQVVLKEERIDD